MSGLSVENKSMEIALDAVKIAIEKKAINPVILELKKICTIADFFVIVTGNSKIQNRAISDAIQDLMKEKGYKLRREGHEDARWILMDYIDVVIHIFEEKEREYYDLEGLWGDASQVNIEEFINLE